MLEFAAKGVFTALVTPFCADGGAIDWDAHERLVEEQLQAGVDGLVPCGTTGEAPTLSQEEQRELIARTVRLARGRASVLAGTGTNCTRTSIERSQLALEAGADAVMLVAPYYNRPCQRGLFEHVRAVAGVLQGPVVLYNVPARSAVGFAVDTVCKIAETCANVVAIKDATNNVHQCQQLLRRLGTRLSVLCGDDALTLPMMSVGARGVISVTSNVVPRAVVRVVRLALDGKWKEAQAEHERLLGVHSAMFHAPSPTPAKLVLAQRGLMQESVRLPLVTASGEERAYVLAQLAEYERR